jgi:hypothetical protein
LRQRRLCGSAANTVIGIIIPDLWRKINDEFINRKPFLVHNVSKGSRNLSVKKAGDHIAC